MMLLCLSASRIYNTFSISTRSLKKKSASGSISFLVHPGRSPVMMLLCMALLGYITRLVSRPAPPPPLPPPKKKKLGSGSISFLAHPGRSPGMMLLCLSPCRIYNNNNDNKELYLHDYTNTYSIAKAMFRNQNYNEITT